VSDPAAEGSPPSDAGHLSDDQVVEEPLTPPGHDTLTEFHEDVESELEGDFASVFLPVIRPSMALTIAKSQLRRKDKEAEPDERFMGL
jgi:hypothetical protein